MVNKLCGSFFFLKVRCYFLRGVRTDTLFCIGKFGIWALEATYGGQCFNSWFGIRHIMWEWRAILEMALRPSCLPLCLGHDRNDIMRSDISQIFQKLLGSPEGRPNELI